MNWHLLTSIILGIFLISLISAPATQNNTLGLGISGTSPITYGTLTDVAGSNCPAELTCSLSPANGTFGGGTWTFNYSTIGNTNYSNASVTLNILVNPAAGNIALLLNGTAGNIKFPVGGEVNASATSYTNQTITLYRNGTDVTSENHIYNTSLGMGYYNYTAVTTANQNFTSVTISRFLNITDVDQYPIFTNCRNFTHTVSTLFSQSIVATDDVGISSYILNDTSVFTVNVSTGLIKGLAVDLGSIEIYYLNITVNDTLNQKKACFFYINVTAAAPIVIVTGSTCLRNPYTYDNIYKPAIRPIYC